MATCIDCLREPDRSLGMPKKTHKLHFQPSARLQALLGRQLLSNEYAAIAELIKNSWDAGATMVRLSFDFRGGSLARELTIADDGEGMDLDGFVTEWMRVGESQKRATGPKRRPIAGEKGIGRFATDKLAAKLIVFTHRAPTQETLRAVFDWHVFERSNVALNEIDIPVEEVTGNDLPDGHGTKLVMARLRSEWTRDRVLRLGDELSDLVQPGVEPPDFKIVLDYDKQDSLLRHEMHVTPRRLPSSGFQLEFALSDGHVRETLLRSPEAATALNRPQQETQEFEAAELAAAFGPTTGRFFYVDSKWTLNRLSLEPGVRVYRDGFRVEPFGRPGDDWLGVQARKASRQGQAPVAPSRLFGFIMISRRTNSDLQDVTSREGLVVNAAFTAFRRFVRERFERLAQIIEEESKKREWRQSRERKAAEEEAKKIQAEARTYGDMASRIAHQLRQPLQTIMSEAGTVSSRLRDRSDDDDVLRKSVEALQRAVTRLDDYIAFMAKATNGLRDTPKAFNLHELVARVVSEFDPVAGSVDVDIPSGVTVTLPEQAVEFILFNLVQNALRATKDTANGQVLIRLLSASGVVRLAVEDKGPGVPEAVRSRLFTSYVTGGGGMGSGLIDSRIVARAHGGDVSLTSASSPTRFELAMPEGEKDGK